MELWKDQFIGTEEEIKFYCEVELKKLSGKYTEEYDGLRHCYAHHIPLAIFI